MQPLSNKNTSGAKNVTRIHDSAFLCLARCDLISSCPPANRIAAKCRQTTAAAMKVNHRLLSARRNRQYCAIEQYRAFVEGILLQGERRTVEAQNFIGQQFDIATKRALPGGPLRLSAQEAIDFITRHVPAPGPDDKHQRAALLRTFTHNRDLVDWTPAVYEALVNVAVEVREPSLQRIMLCARWVFKLSSEEVVSAIRTEAALDPKRRPMFNGLNSSDEETYNHLRRATPALRRASARYLCRAITKQFSKSAGPS